MARRKTKKKWTDEEVEILKHLILLYGTTKGALEAKKEINATLAQIHNKIHNMQSAKVLRAPRISKVKDPQTLAILRKHVSENPNNLRQAFKLTAEDTGLSPKTIEFNWYTKESPLSRNNCGPCFMIVGKTKIGINSKNCSKDNMIVRSKKAIRKFIIKAFGITAADLRS
jgi:hypothetical protein